MKQRINFKLFGGIYILAEEGQWRPITEYMSGSSGKKQQAFLAYLILNHKNRISSAELIKHFWPGDSKDPSNSLKNMIHKIRTLLHAVFPDIPDLLQTQAGCYEWNPEICIETDAEEMDAVYHASKNAHPSERGGLWLNVFELYEGELLPGMSYEWLDQLNTYYRTIYIDTCRQLAVQLLEENKYDDVIRVCSRAFAIAPEIETFTVCAIQAMVNNGVPIQAIRHYETYRTILWEQFNLVPSAAIEQAHTLAVFAAKNSEDYEEKIVQQLICTEEQREAFHCSLLVFQNIVRLEMRHLSRRDRPTCMILLHIETMDSAEPSSTDIRRVERVLLQSLRAGDPFTRLGRQFCFASPECLRGKFPKGNGTRSA